MGIGVSLFLIAVGAVLKFAVNATVSGVEISTVGVILMIIGVVGLLLSLLLIGTARSRHTTTVVEQPVTRTDTTYSP
jgi:beta-lactamase regulating signal transducer with metallopeptidase domain